MAQGGDPKGDGSGGPGYTIPCECYEPNHRLHFRGSLSMAKQEARDTGGSQFFLTFVPTTHLDGKHTVFGRVVEGMDVLTKLQRRDPSAAKPADADKIIEATVVRKREPSLRADQAAGQGLSRLRIADCGIADLGLPNADRRFWWVDRTNSPPTRGGAGGGSGCEGRERLATD